MLQLYIDGHRVNLSEDAKTDFYRRNPYFTNDGDYTLDLDIDLGDPQNARLYHHAYRLDRVRRSSRRTAILRYGTTVIIHGTEVVLDIHDNCAKIQIVAGASEFNYEMGDRKLQELDLWRSFASDEGVYFPVCAFNDSEHADYGMMDSTQYKTEEGSNNKELMWTIVNRISSRVDHTGVIPLVTEIRQPYMWAVVERVIEAIGYSVGENVIKTDSRYSHIVMVHAIRTRYIAETLPEWKVSEFFDEIQKFFNVIIIVDSTAKEVNIVHAWDYFEDTYVEIPHRDIISVKKDYDQKSGMTMMDYTAIHYAFTDKMLNKYADIPKSLTELADSVQAQSVSGSRTYDKNYYDGIWKAITGGEGFLTQSSTPNSVASVFDLRKIYKMTLNGEERQFVLWANEENFCSLKMVNAFAAKESNRSDVTDVEMKIVPVRMVGSPITGGEGSWFQYPLPAVDGEVSSYGKVVWGNAPADSDDESSVFNEEIKSGKKEEEKTTKRADVIFVAYYFGPIPIEWEDPEHDVPMKNSTTPKSIAIASPDWQVQLHRLRNTPHQGTETTHYRRFWCSSRQVKLGSTPMTLAFNGTSGMDAYSYSKNPTVDTSVAYTIQFRCHQLPDVRKIFLIDHRKYYCKELKYDINANRRSEIVEGVFIPLTMTEGGEALFYVDYDLDHVIVDNKVMSLMQGESLDLSLRMATNPVGGSGNLVVHAYVEMGDVDITSTAFTSSGRTGTIHIDAVTGDIRIRAWLVEMS